MQLKQLILLTLTLLTHLCQAQWTTHTLPTKRTNMSGILAEGKVWFTGGWTTIEPTKVPSALVEAFDINTGTWSSVTLSQARMGIAVAQVGQKLYFLGGSLGTAGSFEAVRTIDILDLTTMTMTTDTLAYRVSGMTASVHQGKIYLAGGFFHASDYDNHGMLIYDPATGTTARRAYPNGTKYSQMGVATIGDQIVIAGGVGLSSNESSDIYVYNTTTDLMRKSPRVLSIKRAGVKAIGINGKAYMSGGYDGNVLSNKLDIYDPIAETISNTNMPEEFRDHAVGTHGNLFVTAGGGSSILPTVEAIYRFNTETSTWVTPHISMPSTNFLPRRHQAAVSTPFGLFLGGGETDYINGIEQAVFVYNPVSGTQEPLAGSVSLYPNPVVSELKVQIPQELISAAHKVQITVYDASGQMVHESFTTGSDTTYQMDMTQLMSGIYYLTLRSAGKVWVSNFVK